MDLRGGADIVDILCWCGRGDGLIGEVLRESNYRQTLKASISVCLHLFFLEGHFVFLLSV